LRLGGHAGQASAADHLFKLYELETSRSVVVEARPHQKEAPSPHKKKHHSGSYSARDFEEKEVFFIFFNFFNGSIGPVWCPGLPFRWATFHQ